MGKPANEIRRTLREEIKTVDGVLRNYVSPGHAGVADTLLILPGGRVIFCEIKAGRDKESGPQERERLRMTELGFEAVCVHGEVAARELITMIRNRERLSGVLK